MADSNLSLGLRINFTDSGAAAGVHNINNEINRLNTADMRTVDSSMHSLGTTVDNAAHQFTSLASTALDFGSAFNAII